MLRRILLLLLSLSFLCLSTPVVSEQEKTKSEEDAYFDDAVFVGDSLLLQLSRLKMQNHNEGGQMLGESYFLTAASYNLYLGSRIDPIKDLVTLRYRGVPVSVCKGLQAIGAKKVFILLGMNDGPGNQPDKDMHHYAKMIRHIREFNPGIEIIALSMTPIVEKAQKKNLKQENINLFNERLEVLCKEESVHFLDVASSLKNSDGYLDEALSSDNYVHLGVDGMNIMIDVLYDFARQQLSTNNHAQEVIP